MNLCNFSNTSYHLKWYDNGWQGLVKFLEKNNLDGIELLLHGNEDIKDIPKNIVKGLHLSYFPTWLEFYNEDRYEMDFPNEEALVQTFGGKDKYSIHTRFKRDFDIAKQLEANYMVYHVGHVTIKDAFRFKFDYSNMDVLKATLKIVNDVFVGDGPMLLFENLWWPGLTLLNAQEVEWFMDRVHYKNKGIMLDLSHLMITSPKVSMDESIDYILDVLEKLGKTKRWIKGIHINGTLVYDYLKESHEDKYEDYLSLEGSDRFMKIYEHISSMDQHIPLKHHRLNEIIDVVKPTYKMIEVVGSDKNTWENYVIEQLKVMNVLPL